MYNLPMNNLPMNNPPMNPASKISNLSLKRFMQEGYIVLPGLVDSESCKDLKRVAEEHLDSSMGPIEYEVDVQYPGSPPDQDSEGAMTPRRLLHAYTRDKLFRDWSTSEKVKDVLTELFGTDKVMLSQCHHNCVMTKRPGFSSVTLWHQDNRYWNFDEPNLISVWLALGDENKNNGCLRVVPGTQNLQIDRGRFDAALFLRPDLEENKELLKQAKLVELGQGDVLFFHSRLFHAAGRNLTRNTKYSLVFTYHAQSNRPIQKTRSSRYSSLAL